MANWTTADIPGQKGRIAIITGANSGLGYETALALAGRGAHGPDGIGEVRGYPKVVASSAQSHDVDLQRRLWQVSEQLTGVAYPI